MTRLASGAGDTVSVETVVFMEPDPSELSGARDPLGPLCWRSRNYRCDGDGWRERHNPPEHLSNETAALRGA
jgi:hypothetical protein